MAASDSNPNKPGLVAVFATTRWSVIRAVKEGDSQESHEAMAKLCRIYWLPIYAHLRRDGHAEEDAQDLTQAFSAQLLAREFLSRIEGRNKFFLLDAAKNYPSCLGA